MLYRQLTGNLKLVQAEIEAKFQQVVGERQTIGQKLEVLWRDLEQLRETTITMAQDAIELALALVKTTLQQLDKEVADLVTTNTSTGRKKQKIEDLLDLVVDRVGDAL